MVLISTNLQNCQVLPVAHAWSSFQQDKSNPIKTNQNCMRSNGPSKGISTAYHSKTASPATCRHPTPALHYYYLLLVGNSRNGGNFLRMFDV